MAPGPRGSPPFFWDGTEIDPTIRRQRPLAIVGTGFAVAYGLALIREIWSTWGSWGGPLLPALDPWAGGASKS